MVGLITARQRWAADGYGRLNVSCGRTGVATDDEDEEARRKAALHQEVECRYARQKRIARERFSLPALRVSEIQRFFRHKYGEQLPNDDAGLEDLEILLNQAAGIPGNSVPSLARLAAKWAPWMAVDTRLTAAEKALSQRKRWKADPLAQALGLTDKVRTLLIIRSIGCTDLPKQQRIQRRRARKLARDREYQRRKRLSRGPPRPNLSRSKPWKAQGIGRTKWYKDRRTKKSSNEQDEPTDK